MKLNETIQTSRLASLPSAKEQLACMLLANHFTLTRWLVKLGALVKNANISQGIVQDISTSHVFMNRTNGTMLFFLVFPTATLARHFWNLKTTQRVQLQYIGWRVCGLRRPFISAAGRTSRTSIQCRWMHLSCWRQPSVK